MADLDRAIDQALGRQPADLVLKNARLFNLVTGAIEPTDIALCGDRIVGTHDKYTGRTEIDAAGRIAVPGFIDTHVHVESSLVTPAEFDRCILPRGTTTAICDPHELCNVLGTAALDYMVAAAERTVMDLRVQLSSCVPATALETSGATLSAADLQPYRTHRTVIGLAEFMNVPGVLNKDPDAMEKLAAFAEDHIDGHAPLLGGRDLNAYLSARIRTDHEATTPEEAWEKLSKGMAVLIRDGSVSKDVQALAGCITPETSAFTAFCTDDRNPLDIAEEGHIDHLIRTAIRLGAPPLHVYRAASLSAARLFGLTDRGLVAPGHRADIVLLDDLETCQVAQVICGGTPITADRFQGLVNPRPPGLNSVKRDPVEPAAFHTRAAVADLPVIQILPGKIITDRADARPRVVGDAAVADPAADVLKVAVLARHGTNANIGLGFVRGFGLAAGALASSVGHDSHNLCVVGSNDTDMAAAVNRLIDLQGGFVAVRDGLILGELALPLAGLMSLEPFETVRAELETLRETTRSLGCPLAEPFLQLAFLPLPVIPHLKITDRGVVDVDAFRILAA